MGKRHKHYTVLGKNKQGDTVIRINQICLSCGKSRLRAIVGDDDFYCPICRNWYDKRLIPSYILEELKGE